MVLLKHLRSQQQFARFAIVALWPLACLIDSYRRCPKFIEGARSQAVSAAASCRWSWARPSWPVWRTTTAPRGAAATQGKEDIVPHLKLGRDLRHLRRATGGNLKLAGRVASVQLPLTLHGHAVPQKARLQEPAELSFGQSSDSGLCRRRRVRWVKSLDEYWCNMDADTMPELRALCHDDACHPRRCASKRVQISALSRRLEFPKTSFNLSAAEMSQ